MTRTRQLLGAMIAAVLLTIGFTSPASADEPTFTVSPTSITLLSGAFQDNGHLNIHTTQRSFNVHFEGKCITRTDAECAGERHDNAQFIGKSSYPLTLLPGECIKFVQHDRDNYHFDPKDPKDYTCAEEPCTEEPTEPPTEEPTTPPVTEEPTEPPTEEPSTPPTDEPTTPTPTDEPSTPSDPPTTEEPTSPPPSEEPSEEPSEPPKPSTPPSQEPSSSPPTDPSQTASGEPSSSSVNPRSTALTSTSTASQPAAVQSKTASTSSDSLAETGLSSLTLPGAMLMVLAGFGLLAYLRRRTN